MNPPHAVLWEGNPFPETPAARLPGPIIFQSSGEIRQTAPVNVLTDTIRNLRRQVEDYFGQTSAGRGRALALVGELGAGKTHAAGDLIRRIREEHPADLLWTFDLMSPDLGKSYRDQIGWLRENPLQWAAFEQVVLGYNAEAAAEQLLRDETPGPLRTRREAARNVREGLVDPQKVIETFFLENELVYRDMRRNLGVVTERFREFAYALSLLATERKFRDEVWKWLAGDRPSPALQRKGVTTAISGTSEVLDTLAMFAFLYWSSQQRCVLVLDSAEKVLEWDEHERNAFEGLINVYVNRGGLLVFCIQPEPLSRLSGSLHERITQIWVEGMDQRQCAALVGGYLREHRNPDADPALEPPPTRWKVWPFGDAAFEETARVSDGFPRRLLRLCGQSWREAEVAPVPRREISIADVHGAAHTIYEPVPHPRVLDRIRRTLWELPWPTRGGTERRGSAPPPPPGVEFEVFTGSDTRIALAVFTSVLTEEDLLRIENTVEAVHEGSSFGAHAALVVVNGHLSPGDRDRISQKANTQPLVYDETDFPGLLRDAIRALAERLTASGTSRLATTLNDRVLTLAEQQRIMLASVGRLDENLERLDRSFRRWSAVLPVSSAPGSWSGSAELPPTVRAHFEHAFDELAVIEERAGDLREVFGVDDGGLAPEPAAPRRLAFGSAELTSLGTVTVADRLLRAFQDSVVRWLRGVRASDTELNEEQKYGIFTICRSFELTAEMLPLSRLIAIDPRLPEVLYPLADRIYESVLASVEPRL